jgi:hypothetical protein
MEGLVLHDQHHIPNVPLYRVGIETPLTMSMQIKIHPVNAQP